MAKLSPCLSNAAFDFTRSSLFFYIVSRSSIHQLSGQHLSHPSLLFIGTPKEIGHHASPLMQPLSDYAPQIVDPSTVVDIAKPGDIAVFYSEHFERFRSAIDQLKNNSVATLYMIDGVLEWRNAWENQPNEIACPHTMRPVLCHKVACIGENQARILSSWGNAQKVEVVGVPRFDRYRQSGHAHQRSLDLQNRDTESSLDVLVVTAKTPAFTTGQMETVKRSLLDLKNYAANPANNINLRWRLTAGLEKFLNVRNLASELSGSELFEQMQTVDAMIATPSTSIVEGMLAELPTAVLNYHVCPTYLSAAWQINGPDQIAAVVRELRNPPEAKMMFQRHALAQTLSQQSSATETMATLIRKMADVAKEQIAAEQPLSFSRPLLSHPPLAHAPLDHVQLFPGDQAFLDSNVVELQALLSNARRHIKHQDKRISDLEAELTEAHKIFDQINTHPLAGPVIRLRERILKVLSAGKRNEVLLEDSEQTLPHDSGSPTA